ncbi:MAG TPA: ABC transporter substrate-binding protein [Jatrophihabitantaceae bacterium]
MAPRKPPLARTRPVAVVVAAVACLLLAACGSAVPPSQWANAQRALNGTNGGNGNNSTTGTSNVSGNSANGTGLTGGTGGSNGTGGTGGSSGTGGTGGTNGTSGTTGGSSGGNAAAGITVGSCAGFQNSTGITNTTINIANAADVSGPVSGLFAGVQQAMKAFVAYFNSSSSICGRKLTLESLDSQTSSSGDQQAATTACGNAFAMVGSMGAFDAGGASTVTNCGIPDLRTASTEPQRAASPVVYGAQSLNPVDEPDAPADYYKSVLGSKIQKAAFLYLDAGASSENAQLEIKGWTARGFHFVYTSGIAVTALNYATFVSKMQAAGVEYVQFVGAYQYAVRLAQAMQQQNFKPYFVLDPVAYDPGYVQSGGSAVQGTHIWINSRLFSESGSIPEMQAYLNWLHRVAPSAQPNYFGLFAWSAGRLFTQKALELGGKLTRKSLLAALSTVDNWTGLGMFGPQHVGARVTGGCYGFITLKGSNWVREGPSPFSCEGTVKVG